MSNHKNPNKDRILKNGCYYGVDDNGDIIEGKVLAIAPYGNLKIVGTKTTNYEAQRHIKGL
jgi:hypothetical protein